MRRPIRLPGRRGSGPHQYGKGAAAGECWLFSRAGCRDLQANNEYDYWAREQDLQRLGQKVSGNPDDHRGGVGDLLFPRATLLGE